MRVDFYQLGHGSSADDVIARLGDKLMADGERLLVVAEDDALLARLDRMLWAGERTSFLPHGTAGGPYDPHQPVLLSTGIDAPNGARNLLIADGRWREAAQHFERTFYLFGEEHVAEARNAWRSLGDGGEGERHYWANVDGKWVEKA